MAEKLQATDEQRTRVWSRMAEIKFAAIYSKMCARSASRWTNGIAAFVGIATAGSIVTWTIWQTVPKFWAVVVGATQVLVAAKPYIPFLTRDKDYSDSSNKLERLYLDYEVLFYAIGRGEVTSKACDNELNRLGAKAREIIERESFHAPKRKGLMIRACDERDLFLKRYFPETNI
jgi:hypothetical protein